MNKIVNFAGINFIEVPLDPVDSDQYIVSQLSSGIFVAEDYNSEHPNYFLNEIKKPPKKIKQVNYCNLPRKRDVSKLKDRETVKELYYKYMRCLKERELIILERYYDLEDKGYSWTYKMLAENYNLSVERVRQTAARAITKLKKYKDKSKKAITLRLKYSRTHQFLVLRNIVLYSNLQVGFFFCLKTIFRQDHWLYKTSSTTTKTPKQRHMSKDAVWHLFQKKWQYLSEYEFFIVERYYDFFELGYCMSLPEMKNYSLQQSTIYLIKQDIKRAIKKLELLVWNENFTCKLLQLEINLVKFKPVYIYYKFAFIAILKTGFYKIFDYLNDKTELSLFGIPGRFRNTLKRRRIYTLGELTAYHYEHGVLSVPEFGIYKLQGLIDTFNVPEIYKNYLLHFWD